MVALPESYADAREQPLTTQGALSAALNYATDFITRGDIDVLFTISGGAMERDGQSADPAVWADWLAAWRAVDASEHPITTEEPPVNVQHGYRAFLLLLQRDYEPIDETPMSRVRDDFIAALGGGSGSKAVWERWRAALGEGADADIAFRLTAPRMPPTA